MPSSGKEIERGESEKRMDMSVCVITLKLKIVPGFDLQVTFVGSDTAELNTLMML